MQKTMDDILNTHEVAFTSAVDGHPRLIMLTVLVRGGHGDDCAAYAAIVPDTSMTDVHHTDRFSLKVAAEGNKLSKAEAERLFNLSHYSYRA